MDKALQYMFQRRTGEGGETEEDFMQLGSAPSTKL